MQESLPTSVKTLTRLKATASQPVNNSVSFEKICDDIVSAAKNKVGGAVVVPWWYPRGGTLSERAICDPSAALPALPPLPHLDDLCPVFVSIRDTQSVGQIWSSARRLFFVRQEYRDHQGQHSDLYTRRFLTTLMDIVDAQNQKALAFVALAILPANVGILDDALRPQDSAGPRSVVDLSRNGQCGRVNAYRYGLQYMIHGFKFHLHVSKAELNVSTFNLASVDNAITFTFAAFRNGSGNCSLNGSADSASFGNIICADLLH
ncbi:hypothetical protein B0H65DRAFT_578028 [Neurospora tetraspora]|uniref:Uncharacterized protein n=1 Tax=Neurospora tetraspora TaxID=94610 RepID=A0AAE0JB62_9PEZI|nr:hypothetical protein B0H65DRAFT_578028 [Neurospora tetraspora]